MIAASQVGQQVIDNNPQINSITNDTLKLIQQYLEEQLKPTK